MADFERRLRKLEEQAGMGRDDVEDPLLEACRKRTAELLTPTERRAAREEIDSDPDFRVWFDALVAEAMHACPPGLFRKFRKDA